MMHLPGVVGGLDRGHGAVILKAHSVSHVAENRMEALKGRR